jgi:hypothetical protein
MTRRSLLAFGCMTVLSIPALAQEEAQPSCCAKPAKGAAASATPGAETSGKLKCSLTGKVVDKCCCEERNGKTYCTLAKKNVEKCCCTPAANEDKAAK